MSDTTDNQERSSSEEDASAAESVAAGEASKARSRERGGWFESVLIALLLALFIRHFLFQAYKIPSGSMVPTLLVGDQLIANKISYGIRLPFFEEKLVKFSTPEHGEIVVFRFPEDPDKDFIKRTIGRPGDRVRIEEGIVYVNDQPLRRESLGPYRYEAGPREYVTGTRFREYHGDVAYDVLYSDEAFHPHWNLGELQLGDDELFVMGDNRDRSNDSRFWGPVDLDLLQGRPMFVHFSWDSNHGGIRWDRLGTDLNE